ncbi:MFS general substrate transporter [Neolentinus lepideus HHB14362 ss-1]|uniref:MFS general substrate transporter n=1 Tax=Neolentinus lepideus HHB14362 ss-1 TaxID=1314782 RepID=A0A165UR67_9AGAM|nr:MFS general substrate transporter [Neolentinus lepideus HHB14362 ss-1]
MEQSMQDRTDSAKIEESKECRAPSVLYHASYTSGSLSVLDKKLLLVNRALDDIGMGKYGWLIFFLCGYGYALDLMWAQAFSLIASSAQQEFGISDNEFGNIFTAFNTGLTVGAFTWGLLVDVVGRKWAFNFTVFIASVFGLVLGAAPNWNALCALGAFTGFGIGGNIPIDASIVLEFIPQNRRYLLAALSLFQPLGMVIFSLIAWGLIPSFSCGASLLSCLQVASGISCCSKRSNMGWRYSVYTLGGLTLLCFFLRFVLFDFQESPKFLLSKGKDAEAVAVVSRIAAVNGTTSRLTIEDLKSVQSKEDVSSSPTHTSQIAHLKGFFVDWYMIRLSLFTWLTYIFNYAAFSIAGNFLPAILRRKGAVAGQSISTTYRNYVIIYAPGIVGVLLGAAAIQVPKLGRKWVMTLSAALMGISLFLFVMISSPAANIGFNTMEYFFQSMFNAVLYGWTPEAFPSSFRGSACGVASTWGRLSSIIAPIIATRLLTTSVDGVLYLAGGAALLSAASTIFLTETSHREAL